jgi:uncharacterized protein
MPAVSDTSPLFNLAAIDQLSLLRHALALELGLRRILIDERDGSRVAEQSGLEPVGVLGVLLRAKREGHLESIKKLIMALRDEVGFYIHQGLFQKVLHLAGED